MTHLNPKYNTQAKAEWRDYIYNIVDPSKCFSLVDDNNKFSHKWVELVGDKALTFEQLLSTGRITEDKLIGISRDQNIIDTCTPLYKSADFYCAEWTSFCNTYPNSDIGVFILDAFIASHGKNFNSTMQSTLSLIKRCIDNIGEVLLVVNTDSGMSYRLHSKKNGLTTKETLKKSLENCFKTYGWNDIKDKTIDISTMYEYKQSKKNTTMLSCGILF